MPEFDVDWCLYKVAHDMLYCTRLTSGLDDVVLALRELMKEFEVQPTTLNSVGQTLAFELARLGDIRFLKAAQLVGVDLRHVSQTGNTCLFEIFACKAVLFYPASETQPIECLDFLLDQGLSLNHTNRCGQTPVFGFQDLFVYSQVHEGLEVFSSNYTACENLLNHARKLGANLNHADALGRTCLDPPPNAVADLYELFTAYRAEIQREVLAHAVKAPQASALSRRM